MATSRGMRAVAIGGGHGAARTLRALPTIVDHVTAIVTVADDGGSSGRLRRDLQVVAPGDLRMALTALARDAELARLVGFRFSQGELSGHSLGNLMLVALQSLSGGNLVTALDRCAELLDVPGRVLPCTTVPVTLHAATEAGEVTGQVAIAATSRLRRVWLDPADAPPTEEAVAAIEAADLVVLGPGSLFTSLLPNLLVPGLAAALSRTSGPVVFVTNLREQAGETEGMSLTDQVAALHAHVRGLHLDVLAAHAGPTPSGPGAPLEVDPEALAAYADRVVLADLLDGEDGHDPAKLAAVLQTVLDG
jgi:uncharacterized cofD-like protein